MPRDNSDRWSFFKTVKMCYLCNVSEIKAIINKLSSPLCLIYMEFGYFPVGAGLKPALTRSFLASMFCLTDLFPSWAGFKPAPTNS